MIWKIWIPKIIPNIKVPSHNENIIDIDFGILKILQS